MRIDQKLDIEDFDNDEFLVRNIQFVDKYAELRVRGVYNRAAFSRVFGHINAVFPEVNTKIDLLEASDLYNDLFEAKLKAIPVDEMLSDKKALHGYLDIVYNPTLKESVRVAALKEAAVLAGITVIDNAGRTAKYRSLSDLYDEVGAAIPEAAERGRPTLN